jgi:hypothetical protein
VRHQKIHCNAGSLIVVPSDKDPDVAETAMIERRRALVLGGTGMLSGCVATLVAAGWDVVLPSRRHAPIRQGTEPEGTNRPGSAALRALGHHGNRPTALVDERQADTPGDAVWVQADWSQPDSLAARAGEALGGPADLLVAWVYSDYREAVLHAVAPLLAPGAPVVEVHNSASAKPLEGCPDPVLPDHPTQQVVLGFVPAGERTRWLNHQEIAAGVLTAVWRALDGRPPAVHQVGEFRSWARRS